MHVKHASSSFLACLGPARIRWQLPLEHVHCNCKCHAAAAQAVKCGDMSHPALRTQSTFAQPDLRRSGIEA